MKSYDTSELAKQPEQREKSDRGPELGQFLSTIEEVIDDARNGRMFILMDAEDRENEGDLVIPAQMASPEAVNFMARYGRGLICLSLNAQRCEELQLPLMSQHNDSRHRTAFTVSIEAKEGITTGISAHDRAHTIAVAIDPTRNKGDIVSPGHVFPLVARDGGVLVRTGHTEAAVDIARLAGLYPAGVICEIMNDDGTMARAPELIKFAQFHGLKIATIEDLIAYRLRNDQFVRKKREESAFESIHGKGFRLLVYEDGVNRVEHLALVKGEIGPDDPVLVRVHAANVVTDLLGSRGHPPDTIAQCMRVIEQEGRGIIVIIRDLGPTVTTPDSLQATMDRMAEGKLRQDTELRHYGIGAQILRDLGVRTMTLLTNTTNRKIIGLTGGWGLKVAGVRAIPTQY